MILGWTSALRASPVDAVTFLLTECDWISAAKLVMLLCKASTGNIKIYIKNIKLSGVSTYGII